MIIANAVFYNGTEAEKVYLGNDLVWEKSSTPKPAHQIMGKFTDDSTEENWKCKINENAITLPVDPTTKEFGYDYEGEVTSLYEMFYDNNKLKSIDLSGLDTSKVANMSCTFQKCSGLEGVNLSGIDTSEVTTMSCMFQSCSRLESVDLSGLNTEKVTDMHHMFQYCSNLESANLSGLTNDNVTNMYQMFYGTKVKFLNLTNFKTPNVTNMHQMFSWGSTGSPRYTTLDLTSFDTSKVTDMGNMFYLNQNLQSIDLSSFNTSRVTDMSYMFCGCALISLDVSNFNVSRVTDFNGAFMMNHALTTLNLSGWNITTSKCSEMFNECESLTTVLGPITGIKFYLDLHYSPLTNASAMVFINGLAEVTEAKTITFKKTTYDTLTPEQIAVATSKGWNVVRSAS